MGRKTQRARVRRKRTLIAMACTAVVVAVFAVVAVAMHDTTTAPSSAADDATGQAPGTVGTEFPDFTLTSAGGEQITRASLAGMKTLVWFTDSSCPDADGIARTAALDDQLGRHGFRVLAVLVNLRQPSPLASEWRDAFGRPDWLVTADEQGALSTAVKLPAVETKFLLDEHGTVLNVSTDLITDQYLALLREKTTV